MRPLVHPAGLFSWRLGQRMRAVCACAAFGPTLARACAAAWLREQRGIVVSR